MTKPSLLPPSLSSLSWVLVLVAGMLAYFLSLRADYYMDDFMFVVNSKGDGPAERYFPLFGTVLFGSTGAGSFEAGLTEILPYFIHRTVIGIFGPNPAASHAVNLLLHIATALVIFRCTPPLLKRLGLFSTDDTAAQRAGLLGALVFVCHPFASEGVNYAKCINIQLVTLFSVWFASAWTDLLSNPRRKAAIACGAAFLLLTISYHPGMFIGAALIGFLTLASLRGGSGTLLRNTLAGWRGLSFAARLAVCVIAATVAAKAALLIVHQFTVKGALYPAHLLTQGRLIWEYIWRFFVPVRLCSDHLADWSVPGRDNAALLLAVTFGALFLGMTAGAVFCRRGAAKGVLILAVLWLLPLAMRFTYPNFEPMVEYRAYPALPWFGLLAGCGLSWLFAQYRIPALALTSVVLVKCIVMSAERSHVWHDRADLAADVLARYPKNIRAVVHLQAAEFDAHEYTSVLQRHEVIASMWDSLHIAARRRDTSRLVDSGRLDTSLVESCQFAAMALAEIHGSKPALDWAEKTITGLREVMPAQFTEPGPAAWPILSVRDSLRDHGTEIDRLRAARNAPPAG